MQQKASTADLINQKQESVKQENRTVEITQSKKNKRRRKKSEENLFDLQNIISRNILPIIRVPEGTETQMHIKHLIKQIMAD